MNAVLEKSAKDEINKFFTLSIENVPNLSMMSEFIDSVWHDMLKDESEYKEYCESNFGKVIGHTTTQGEGEISWIKDYEAKYGLLSPLWFTNKNGFFDQKAYQSYLDTGIVKASWDCTPS
ncbi:hypothetical protein CR203_23345 [Salipaludibacillus neizhouensis]|uniref:Uncharacterized protein n=1 Tax=Salipaludibacillus neizhouensis TaxID=885475 RepID=A0A3A9KJ78_9BACI|nr:hypothetical protein [Salipaludibacillus neizhouensis]RKL64946.1 hypothetical protein CR203_23345 [Salipaludibacillus neizhouensis]